MNSLEIPSTESITIPIEQPESLLLADILPADLETTASIFKKTIEEKIYGKDAPANDPNGLLSKLKDAGFSDEESTGIMSCSSESDIVETLADIHKGERQALALELGNESLKEKVAAGMQSLRKIFEDAGANISDKNVRVEHGGKVVRLVNDVIKFGFVPVCMTEIGEHFSKHGRTYVYHTGNESVEIMATVQIHESTHGFAYNQFVEDETNEDNTNGFARCKFNKVESGKSVNKFNAFNEGFTEYLARKALTNSINYDTMPIRAYDMEVELVKNFIALVSSVSHEPAPEIEKQLVRAYNSSDASRILKEMSNSHCGPYAHIFLDDPEIPFFKALHEYSQNAKSGEIIDIDISYLKSENIQPQDFIKAYPFTRIIQKDLDDKYEKLTTTVIAE